MKKKCINCTSCDAQGVCINGRSPFRGDTVKTNYDTCDYWSSGQDPRYQRQLGACRYYPKL